MLASAGARREGVVATPCTGGGRVRVGVRVGQGKAWGKAVDVNVNDVNRMMGRGGRGREAGWGRGAGERAGRAGGERGKAEEVGMDGTR